MEVNGLFLQEYFKWKLSVEVCEVSLITRTRFMEGDVAVKFLNVHLICWKSIDSVVSEWQRQIICVNWVKWPINLTLIIDLGSDVIEHATNTLIHRLLIVVFFLNLVIGPAVTFFNICSTLSGHIQWNSMVALALFTASVTELKQLQRR